MSRSAVLAITAVLLYVVALIACERTPPVPGMRSNFHVPSAAMAPTLVPTQPFAREWRHRAEEITLRCRAHNRYAAIQDYGFEHMQRWRPSS